VVDDFVRATLGTVPGAAIDYDQARSLMTVSYAREFDSAGFVPIAYGIQDGPTTYEIGDEETSGSTATVTVLGYWGGELGRRWGFALQQEEGAWRIAAINSLPVASSEPMPDAASGSLEALIGEWEIVEDDVDAGERFRLQLEPDGRLRLRLVDEYIDIEGIEDLDRFYLELEPEGARRWVGDAVNVEWDPETDEITEWSREPVVILLSDDGEEMLLGPPESEGVVARRVP
jgi:hypothetical protein